MIAKGLWRQLLLEPRVPTGSGWIHFPTESLGYFLPCSMESALPGETPSYKCRFRFSSGRRAINNNNSDIHSPCRVPSSCVGRAQALIQGLGRLPQSIFRDLSPGGSGRAVPQPQPGPASRDRLNWECDCSRNVARRHLILRGCRLSRPAPSPVWEPGSAQPTREARRAGTHSITFDSSLSPAGWRRGVRGARLSRRWRGGAVAAPPPP